VALPQLTDEQRAAALQKAAAARRARAELKDRLKRGGTNLQQVLKDAETNEVLGKMKVSALLEALPRPSAQGSAGKVRLRLSPATMQAEGPEGEPGDRPGIFQESR
jgi:hypothetical protein